MALIFDSQYLSGSLYDRTNSIATTLSNSALEWRGNKYALKFNGTSSYASLTLPVSLGTGNFTIMWGDTYPQTQTGAYAPIIVSEGFSQGAPGLRFGISHYDLVKDGLLYQETNNASWGTQLSLKVNGITNGYHLFCVQRDTVNKLVIFYIDGVLASSQSYTTATNISTTNVLRIKGSYLFSSGYFSQLKIFNHLLTAPEVINEFTNALNLRGTQKPIRGFIQNRATDLSQLKGTGPTQGLVAAFNALTKGIVVDISGNLKNGTPTNCISTKDGILLSGVNSKVVFGNIGAVKSVSFRFKPLSATCKIMEKAANSGLIYNNSGTLVAADFSSIYVNGIASPVLTVGQWHNVVLTSATDVNFSACTLGLNNTTYGAFEIEDLRFWTKTLSVQESKDYHNAFAKRIVLVEDFSDASADGITF